jgi:hypothetical protein
MGGKSYLLKKIITSCKLDWGIKLKMGIKQKLI